jgi:hypothetical protein
MKIEKQYCKNFLVHAISILDLDLIKQILKAVPTKKKDKVEMNFYLRNFKVIFKSKLEKFDTHFEVKHGKSKTSNAYIYTFTANYSRKNFSIKFIDAANGMFYIEECHSKKSSKTINFSSFVGDDIEVPF